MTGQLEGGISFGSQYREVLPPVYPQDELPQFGHDSADEREFVGEMTAFRNGLRDRANSAGFLKPKQRASILEILDRATDLQSEVSAVYQKWDRFPCARSVTTGQPIGSTICPWPLSRGDALHDWQPGCDGSWDSYRGSHGTNPVYTCPPPATVSERHSDRAVIAEKYIGILHHLRCSQYLLTRLALYRMALRDFRENHMHGNVFGAEPPVDQPGPSPYVWQGGIQQFDPPDPVDLPDKDPLAGIYAIPFNVDDLFEDDDLPDNVEPDPFDLPDPDDLPDDDKVGEGAPGVDDRVGSVNQQQRYMKYGAIGLGIAAIGAVVYQVTK